MATNDWRESAFASTFPEGCVRVCEGNGGGAYEGWGTGIAYNPATGKYLVAEYSHCSCYGPLDSMSMHNEYDSLIDALRGSTNKAELWADLKHEVENG